jgi:DnaJ-class molecular chaperone
MADELKLIACPGCRGSGELIEYRLYPSGHTEVLIPCELCDGVGEFEEDEYIVMRLEGSV